MTVISRLKKLMEEKNMTQHDICHEFGCQITTLGRWLRGHTISEAYERLLSEWLTRKGY